MILKIFLDQNQLLFWLDSSFRRKAIESRYFLAAFDRFLKESGFKISDLKGAALVAKDARFSSMRQIVAVLNAFAFVLGIKIAAFELKDDSIEKTFQKGLDFLKKRKAGDSIKPFYYKPPNITKKQRY